MRFVPFRPMHLLAIEPQAAQPVGLLKPDVGLVLQMMGEAWTALDGERPIACAGLLDQGEGRAAAWALFDCLGLACMAAIHRRVMRALERASYRRIETAVALDHPAGHRWAERLGFDEEGVMRRWFWNGADAVRYARVREG